MEFSSQDVRQLVSSVASLMQAEARRRQIHLALELPARLPRLMLDAERIQQVLINLIGNSLKFTPAGGEIKVAVRQRNGSLEISVCDTGIGIAPADCEHIFGEFSQVKRQANGRQPEGSGLGLAITRRIVEAHEGSITVTSTPGKGSIFRFTLPLRYREEKAAVSA
jgi:signal transduction histidine kinase